MRCATTSAQAWCMSRRTSSTISRHETSWNHQDALGHFECIWMHLNAFDSLRHSKKSIEMDRNCKIMARLARQNKTLRVTQRGVSSLPWLATYLKMSCEPTWRSWSQFQWVSYNEQQMGLCQSGGTPKSMF
jgi:hypothetical protein